MCWHSTSRNFLKFWCKHFIGQKNPLKFTPVVRCERGVGFPPQLWFLGPERMFLIISFFPLTYYIRAGFSRHCCKPVRNFTNHKENLILLVTVLILRCVTFSLLIITSYVPNLLKLRLVVR